MSAAMPLVIYLHLLPSYSQKAKTAFYEKNMGLRGEASRRQRADHLGVFGKVANQAFSDSAGMAATSFSKQQASSNISTRSAPATNRSSPGCGNSHQSAHVGPLLR